MASNWSTLVEADALGYLISKYAYGFHNLKHFDYTFQAVPSTFNLTSPSYVQSLTTWALIPIILLLGTWITLAACLCCPKKKSRRRNICPFQCFIIICLIIAGVAIGVSLYGNESIDRSINNVETSISSISSTIKDADDEVHKGTHIFNISAPKHVKKLAHYFDSHIVANVTVRKWLHNRTMVLDARMKDALIDISKMNIYTDKTDLDEVADELSYYEYLRWSVTIGIQCWKIVLGLVLLFALLRLSKHWILAFAILCGTTGLLFAWGQSALYISAAIAIGDFCYGLDSFIESQVQIEKDVIEYYLHCDKNYKNPFSDFLTDMTSKVQQANMTVQSLDKVATQFSLNSTELTGIVYNLTALFNKSSDNIQKIGVLVDCSNVHKSYTYAASNVCLDSFNGLFLMMISTTILGVFFLLMIITSSWLKAHIRVRHYYIVDEDDPFIPRTMEGSETSSFLSNYDHNTASNRTLYGSLETNPTASSVVNRSDSPPPQYVDEVNSHGSSPDMYPYRPPPSTGLYHSTYRSPPSAPNYY